MQGNELTDLSPPTRFLLSLPFSIILKRTNFVSPYSYDFNKQHSLSNLTVLFSEVTFEMATISNMILQYKWCNVYEMIHIWTADIYEGDMWSSQWISNLSNWNKEEWKKSGLQRDSNPCAMLYQLSYEATHWERGQLWVHIFPWKEWNDVIYMKWL